MFDHLGDLLFATVAGGPNGAGALYKQSPFSGDPIIIYAFAGLTSTGQPQDGAAPLVNIIRDKAGNMYGTTAAGDGVRPDENLFCLDLEGGCGTVFKIDEKTHKETILHSFNRDDGQVGFGIGLDDAGNIYGTVNEGIANSGCKIGLDSIGCGAVFKINPAGNYSIVHSFSHRFIPPFKPPPGVPPPGLEVLGDTPSTIIVEPDGTVFGVAQAGGNFGLGLIFKIDPSGNYSILHHWAGPIDGWNTQALILKNGKLYGANANGGDILNCGFGGGCGTIFQIDVVTGDFKVLHTFHSITEGEAPTAIFIDQDGNLFGSNAFGGDLNDVDSNCLGLGCGTIFKLSLR